MDEFWEGKSVFITGATGMVGSRLVKDLLSGGAKITVLVRDTDPQSELYRCGSYKRCSVVQGSLEDFWTLERAINEHEIDSVFHLGAQTIVGTAYRSPLQTFESNIRGTYNLLEACRIHSDLVERIVIASSDKAYGESPILPYSEESPLLGRYPYDVSKTCSDLLAQSYHHTYGTPVAIARCGNTYGEGDLNWNRIVPGTIKSIHRRESPVIRSDGTYLRDYIYLSDVSLAYLLLAEALTNSRKKVQGEAFNFGLGDPKTVLDIVTKIQQIMEQGNLGVDIQNTAIGEISSQYLSSDKANRVLCWYPRFTLDQGLMKTVIWYCKYLNQEIQS